MTDGFAAEYGYVGIVVALVAGNGALAVIPAAVFFSFLRQGGGLLEARVGVPLSIVTITTGTVIILLASASRPVERLRTRRAGAAPAGTGTSRRRSPRPDRDVVPSATSTTALTDLTDTSVPTGTGTDASGTEPAVPGPTTEEVRT